MKKYISLAATLAVVSAANAATVLDETYPGIIDDGNSIYRLTQSVDLSNDTFILPGQVFATSDAVVTIRQGTIIRGIPGAGSPFSTGTGYKAGTLVITQDAQIVAEGTAAQPIVFTTAALNNAGQPSVLDYSAVDYTSPVTFWDNDPIGSPKSPVNTDAAGYNLAFSDGTVDLVTGSATKSNIYQGLWGGLIILGEAPTSNGLIVGTKVSAENNQLNTLLPHEGQIEGLDIVEVGALSVYGGRFPNDSSGTLRYVSIRHGGDEIATANEVNGLTLGGVGAGTKIEYVEVYANQDDAFEFFGGTVNTRFLVALASNDDSFDIDEGFTGLGQFWFSMQLDDQTNGNTTGEHDGTDDKHDSVDMDLPGLGSGDSGGGLVLTYPTIYNATYIGGGLYGNRNSDYGTNGVFVIRDSFGGAYFNSIFSDHRDWGIALAKDGDERWNLGDVVFRSNLWYGNNAAYTSGTFVGSETLAGSNDVHEDDNNSLLTDFFADASNKNVFNVDPWAASNRVTGSAGGTYDGQLARRKYIPEFDTLAGGFDPAELSAAALSSVAATSPEPYTSTFFVDPGFIGAFDPSSDLFGLALWTDTWTVFSKKFYQDR